MSDARAATDALEVMAEAIHRGRYYSDLGKFAAQDVLNALGAAGWQVVPKEPTEGMRKAGTKEFWEAHRSGFRSPTEDCYRAMLAAAPRP